MDRSIILALLGQIIYNFTLYTVRYTATLMRKAKIPQTKTRYFKKCKCSVTSHCAHLQNQITGFKF